jgi:hypothetical protein
MDEAYKQQLKNLETLIAKVLSGFLDRDDLELNHVSNQILMYHLDEFSEKCGRVYAPDYGNMLQEMISAHNLKVTRNRKIKGITE